MPSCLLSSWWSRKCRLLQTRSRLYQSKIYPKQLWMGSWFLVAKALLESYYQSVWGFAMYKYYTRQLTFLITLSLSVWTIRDTNHENWKFSYSGMFQIPPCTQVADFLEPISFLLDKKMGKLVLHTPLSIGRADIQQ